MKVYSVAVLNSSRQFSFEPHRQSPAANESEARDSREEIGLASSCFFLLPSSVVRCHLYSRGISSENRRPDWTRLAAARMIGQMQRNDRDASLFGLGRETVRHAKQSYRFDRADFAKRATAYRAKRGSGRAKGRERAREFFLRFSSLVREPPSSSAPTTVHVTLSKSS